MVSLPPEYSILHGDRRDLIFSDDLYRIPLAAKWENSRLVGTL